MNITLWIITAILALLFLAAGTMKLAQPKGNLAAAVAAGRFGPFGL